MLLVLILASNYNSISAEKKILRWAADSESGAPYVFEDESKQGVQIGFEVDIIKEICRMLDYQPAFFQNQWDGLIPGLDRNDYDVAINGIEITDERKDKILFSIPYYITFEQLVVRKDDNHIKNLKTLKGKAVGTLSSSLAETILKELEGVEIRTYESEYNSFTDLKLGRIDAVLIDAPVAIQYAKPDPELKFVGPEIKQLSYGIAIKLNNIDLKNSIDSAIRVMTNTGKLKEILTKWSLWEPDLWNKLMDVHTANSNIIKIESQIKKSNKTFSERVQPYINWLPELGKAALLTLNISLLSMILAMAFGLMLVLLRVFAPTPISKLTVVYIELIRGTPLLMQLFFIYYVFPVHLGIKLDPFVAAVIGLGLNYAAYEAENYRAGLFAVPRGQIEAAISLGMRKRDTLKHIVFPQAIRLVIPPMTNDFISLLKDSSLVSVIAMVELTKAYGKFSSTMYDYIVPGLIVAAIYLLLGLPFVKIAKWAENKFSHDKKRS